MKKLRLLPDGTLKEVKARVLLVEPLGSDGKFHSTKEPEFWRSANYTIAILISEGMFLGTEDRDLINVWTGIMWAPFKGRWEE